MSAADFAQPLPAGLWGALTHPWTWRMAWRDSRSQRKRLIIFSLSIIAGIGALVAIHALKSSAQAAIETQARALLGSDLQISFAPAHSRGNGRCRSACHGHADVSHETTLSTMVYFPKADAARLVQIRGLEAGYPYYGTVETTPPGAWTTLQTQGGILVEPALLDQFQAKVGDHVKLGSLELTILGTVTKAPARSSRFGAFSPEAYVRLTDLQQTGLLAKSSLAFYNLHLELAQPNDARKIQKAFPETAWRYETPKDRRNTLGNALDNFQQFLGIIALAALVLGAIGVSGAIHAHITRRVPTVAVLRCLGCPGNLAFAIYLVQTLTLGCMGALTGALLGVALETGVIRLFRASLPIAIEAAPPWLAVAGTTAAGLAVCCGFALLPLLRIRQISPIALLRSEAALTPGGRVWPFYLVPAALLALLAALDTAHWLRALAMTGGLAAAFLLLAGTAKGLGRARAENLSAPRWLPYLLRQGISNLHRPHNQTLLFLLSLGLGTFLLLTILLTKNLLLHEASTRDRPDSPNVYLVDVQQPIRSRASPRLPLGGSAVEAPDARKRADRHHAHSIGARHRGRGPGKAAARAQVGLAA